MAAPDSPNAAQGVGETLASFEVYVSSPDREADRHLVRAIQEFDGEYGSSNVSDDGGIAREVRRIVKGYFPEGVTVRDVRIRYGESAELTLVLVLSTAYAIYDFIAKYEDFRKGLDRIADDVFGGCPIRSGKLSRAA
ncbi:MAG: hypothetical protein ACKVW3_07055 [Phycisphaerales bacterium]